MHITSKACVVALTALVALCATAGSAGAATISAGGTPLSSGDRIQGATTSPNYAVIANASMVSCDSDFVGAITSNPTLTIPIGGLTLTACIDTFPIGNWTSGASTTVTSMTLAAAGGGNGTGTSTVTVRYSLWPNGTTCTLSGTLFTGFTASTQRLTLSGTVTRVAGTCFYTNWSFNGTYDLTSLDVPGAITVT